MGPPVVNFQAAIRRFIQPPTFDENRNKFLRVAPVVDSESDILVGQLSDVTAGRFPGCQVPDGLHEPYSLPEGDIQTTAQPFHLGMPHGLAFHKLL